MKYKLFHVLSIFLLVMLTLPHQAGRVYAQQEGGEFLAGVPANLPPEYSIDSQTGKPAGFAIDSMDEVARRSGIKVKYVVYPTWPKTVEAIEKGEVVLIPSIGILAEREAYMEFTSSVATSDIVIFVREAATDIKSAEDLKGKDVAVVEKNSGLYLMRKRGGSRLQIYASQDEAFLSLISGKSDALVFPESPIKLLSRKAGLEGRIKIVGEPLLEVKLSIAVRKGNHELLKKLDNEVKTFIKTPRYEELYAKWYGKPEPYWTARRVAVFGGGLLAVAIVSLVVWRYLSLLRLNRELKAAAEERKKAEEALREREERLRAVIEQSPVGIAFSRDGVTLDANKVYLSMFGYADIEELRGKPLIDQIAQQCRPEIFDRIKRRARDQSVETAYETIGLRKDGSQFPFYVSVNRVVLSDGPVTISFFIDITARKQAEDALRAAHDRFYTVLNSVDALIYVADMDTHEILFVNEMLKDIFGDVVGKICWQTLQQGQAGPCAFCTSDRLIGQDGEPSGIYHWQIRNTITGRWYDCHDRGLRWMDGRRARLEIATDVTDLKLAQDRAVDLAGIVDNSLNEIYIFDASTLRFLEVNKGARTNLGYTIEELRSLTPIDLKPEFTPDSFARRITPLKSGQQKLLQFTTVHRRKDGSRYPVEVHLQLLSYGASPAFVAIILDITERTKAEEALRENQSRLDLALRSAGMGVWHWDIIENKRYFDDKACRLLGINPATFTGAAEEFYVAVHPDDLATIKAALARTIEQDVLYEPEYRAVWPDGSVHYITARGRLVRDDKGLRINGIIWDITGRKKAEEELNKYREHLEELVNERTVELEKAQEAMVNIVEDLNEKSDALAKANIRLQELDRLKSMFIASMSHELRTPLNSIIGFSSMLLHGWRGQLENVQKEDVEIMHKAGKHLLALINDVIDVSKVEAGAIEILPEEFDLDAVINEAVNLVRKELEAKGLALQINSMHCNMRTDRRRLLQCILNILNNAAKFTEKGSVRITALRIQNSESRIQEKEYIEISVTDTGIGICEDDIPKLFQPFVRLESPLKAKVSGTGLGLYLTRKLAVEALNGNILVESECGKGSRFTLRIPLNTECGLRNAE